MLLILEALGTSVFFFSCGRRHTRSLRDWSSDVCSSDLSDIYPGWPYQFSWSTWDSLVTSQINQVKASGITNLAAYAPWNESDNSWLASNGTFEDFWKIGRASCRERVYISVVACAIKRTR